MPAKKIKLEERILRAIKKNRELTTTQIYKLFHREKAKNQHDALNNLFKDDIVRIKTKRTSCEARKPTTVWYINDSKLNMPVHRATI